MLLKFVRGIYVMSTVLLNMPRGLSVVIISLLLSETVFMFLPLSVFVSIPFTDVFVLLDEEGNLWPVGPPVLVTFVFLPPV